MKNFRLILVFITAAMLIALSGCKDDRQDSDSPVRLSYANFAPASTFVCVQMERWADEVEKRTGGKVLIDTYPGGTLLGAKDMIDGVIAGQADIGCLCMAYQPGRFATTNATSLPVGIPDAVVGTKVLNDLYEKYQPKAFDNVKVVTMFTNSPANIMSKKPVRNLDDIKGMSIRASGGAAKILSTWGANYVGMPMSETPEAIQKGVVDGLFSSVEVLKDFEYAALCRYVTMTDTVIYPFSVVMNKRVWESLPADVQKVIDELKEEQALWTAEYMEQHVEEAIEWSKLNHHIEVIELNNTQKARFNELLNAVVDQWVIDESAKGLPAERIVKDIEAMVKKYSAAK
jgi:TRAP-type transport system periplasmic protein